MTTEVFIKAFEGISRYEDKGVPFLAWLYAIAHARLVDQYRRSENSHPIEVWEEISEEVIDSNLENLDDSVEQKLNLQRVMDIAQQSLTFNEQQVIQSRFFESKRIGETAAIMNKTKGAVKMAQRRAIDKIRIEMIDDDLFLGRKKLSREDLKEILIEEIENIHETKTRGILLFFYGIRGEMSTIKETAEMFNIEVGKVRELVGEFELDLIKQLVKTLR